MSIRGWPYKKLNVPNAVEPTLTVKLQPPPAPPGPIAYCAYNEVEMVEKRGMRSGVTAYEQFVEGDRVRVTADVLVRGEVAQGKLGTVVNAWSQCETDPACCCNELATDAPLEVQLDGACAELVGYFCEDEVEVVEG